MGNEHVLTSEELINYIREVSNAHTVNDIREITNKMFSDKQEVIESLPQGEASIYAKEALPYVREDMNKEKEEDKVVESTPILEKKINNPWEGLRTVTPGNN